MFIEAVPFFLSSIKEKKVALRIPNCHWKTPETFYDFMI